MNILWAHTGAIGCRELNKHPFINVERLVLNHKLMETPWRIYPLQTLKS